MDNSRAFNEASPPQVQFSEIPPDVVQNVQVVPVAAAALSSTVESANQRVFFSEPPPDVVQNVQVASMPQSEPTTITHQLDWMNPSVVQSFSQFVGRSIAMEAPSNPDNFYLLTSGVWNSNTSLNVQGGQSMWFKIRNTNVLGTTIHISDQSGQVKQSIILPASSVEFVFSVFGVEPMGWRFDIRTESDAFMVTWELWSTWVPGMPPNR